MKTLNIVLSFFFFTINAFACDFFDYKSESDIKTLMGKKSKFYDAYKQGKCVLEDALKPLSSDQKKIIANLIAKNI